MWERKKDIKLIYVYIYCYEMYICLSIFYLLLKILTSIGSLFDITKCGFNFS